MISGKILRDAIISGANNINNQRSRVDELNVFPVPDGDTGTNMGGAAVRELEALSPDCTVAEAAKTAASAMLRGARGNSGVITSLLFRGFSKALEGKKEAGADDLVSALEKGVEAAYKAVMKPTEGTILTVARIASEEARASKIADVPQLWDLVLSAGQRALDNTPNQLPVLKKAGVVDAGGQGIMIIFEGMGKVFHGEDIIPAAEATQNKAKLSTANAGRGVFTDDLMKVEDIKNGYCTQFLIHKDDGASAAKMRAFAESNGDSVVCIEDDDVINLHVHTADPGKILTEAIKYGYLTNFKIENMHEQFLARQKQGKSLEKQAEAEQKQRVSDAIASEFVYAAVDPSRDYGFVAVAAGEGLKAVFTDLSVDAVVSGGQTTGDDFTWWASESTLSVVYESDGARADMAYYYSDNHLYVDGIPLVVNDGSAPGGGEATPLIGQWEGRISGYYSTVFGLADDSCFTTCEFASNGDGVQLDYNIHRPMTDYAYTPFTWSLADGVIVLNYVENDNEWLKRAIINDYALSATRFSGTVAYGQQWFGFVFTATEGFDWSPYIGGITRAAASSRMRMSRQVRCAAVRSGAFAR